MDSLALLDAEAAVLAELVRSLRVPRTARPEARALLAKAFQLQAQRDEPSADAAVAPGDAAIPELIDAIEALIRRAGGAPSRPLRALTRAAAFVEPVRIGRPRWKARISTLADRYLRVGKRAEARLAWFWKRCEPAPVEPKREQTAKERAAEEFGGEEREFVWGRKRRGPQEPL